MTFADPRQALCHFFHFDDFLDNQRETVEKILEGRDLCVIMPTGAGKSLCYQLPILMRPGYGLVISPLISLMKDQVDALRERGIAAACVNSMIGPAEQQAAFAAAATGELKLLYVAPERFDHAGFLALLANAPPSLVVVDEAHCISQWGHDFRPSYVRMGEVLERLGAGQICGFTATATKQVRDDIRKQLRRPDMELQVAGFKRPNLRFSVAECPRKEDKERVIAKLLADPKPTIIYASTRKAVEELAATFKCIPYHAGMSDEDRTEAQDRFMNDRCPVLAATNAFGMGIDRSDVRRVIHYNLTGSLEAYYQEAGRAGRDGEDAECILLFSYSDRFIQEFLIDMSNPPPELVRSLFAVLCDLSAQAGGKAIEMNPGDLASLLPEAKNDSAVSNALSVLEKAGVIGRSFNPSARGVIRFTGDLGELAQLHGGEATQRSRFISRMIRTFGDALKRDFRCSFEELVRVAGLNIEQLKRVLRALDGECLSWQPPFGGRAIEVLARPEEELGIDFAELERKHQFELSRLEDVIGYTRRHNCRQHYLVSYFGEDAGAWRCENCDLCDADTGYGGHALRKPDQQEATEILAVLGAVDFFDGRLGSGKIGMILAGARRAEIVEKRLDRTRFFGKLKHLKQNEIIELLRMLESVGAIAKTGSVEYPCLGLTAIGLEYLNGEPLPEFPLAPRLVKTPGATKRNARVPVAPDGSDDDDFERLRSLRARLARQRGVPAYVIMTDAAMAAFAKARPATPDEALEIKGIGPAKLADIVPLFIAELQKSGGDGDHDGVPF
ncbi:MAG: RecQ family ATP-dependent DNA helicase [Victivallaceae bacterium]